MKRWRIGGSEEDLAAFAKSRNALDEVPPLSGRSQHGQDAEAPPSPFASKVKPEDERRVLDMVTVNVYADDPHWSDDKKNAVIFRTLPPRTDADAAEAIARGERTAAAEEKLYLKGDKDDPARWSAFWDLNRRWRRMEAWLGAESSRNLFKNPESGLSRWLPLWKSYSHDFKRGIDRSDPVEVAQNTSDMERSLSWFGYPKAYHQKDPNNKESIKPQRKGDGTDVDPTAGRSGSSQVGWMWAAIIGVTVLGGGWLALKIRRSAS